MTVLPPAESRSRWRRWLLGGLACVVAISVAALAVVLGERKDAPATAAPPPTPAYTTPAAATPAETTPAPTRTGETSPSTEQLGGLRPAPSAATARDLLGALPIAEEALAGYDRDDFGPSWSDIDGNGCNQRDDVLLRDAMPGTVRTAQQGACDHDVLAGRWYDPYTGTVLIFDDMKDPQQAQALQIDHVVPLAEAHHSGAYVWTPEEKKQFANDLADLVAVGGAANAAKGDSDPAEWLPPAAVRCAYVETWLQVKTQWSLTADAAERDAISRVLDGC